MEGEDDLSGRGGLGGQGFRKLWGPSPSDPTRLFVSVGPVRAILSGLPVARRVTER
jgi:hypothetical protein